MTVVWRHLRSPQIDHELLWLSVGAGTVLCVGLALTAPNLQVPRCAFKTLTGLPCPTCGATRASLALARGEIATAFSINPLVCAAIAAAGLYLAYAAIVLAGRLPRLRLQLSRREVPLARAAAVVLIVLNWAYLIAASR
jgi:Protein of unknown function (DUF2752)